jgi:FdhD protein
MRRAERDDVLAASPAPGRHPPAEAPPACAFEVAVPLPPRPGAPRLLGDRGMLLRPIEVIDETGERRRISIPVERPLTLYVDRREVVTLMTLGAAPELLALGYLFNQRLVERLDEVESVTVDGSVDAVAVRTHAGQGAVASRLAHRVVTTGCGQGTVFGQVLDGALGLRLPPPAESRLDAATLFAVLEAMRQRDSSVHRLAGSVHGCALFRGRQLLVFVEDVGRHNAVDTIAGWMELTGTGGADALLYTTGRLTSEMVLKAAQMGVPTVVSRNGVTAMGHELATRLGMTLFGRAANRRFVCYAGAERFDDGHGAEPDIPSGPGAAR